MKLRRDPDSMSRSLDAILCEDDDLNLLNNIKPPKPKESPKEDQAITAFKKLVEFFGTHKREPNKNNSDERTLAIHLEAYRTRPELRTKVQEYDTIGLLQAKGEKPREVTTLDDIFDDDDMDLLGGVDESIFNLNNVKPSKEKDQPDEIGSSKPCADFYRYEKFFQDLQKVLHSKSVMLERFSRKSDASVGQVFILRGLLCYVDSVISEGINNANPLNPRLRVIFANGTETDLLKLSLARALYKDPHSRRVNFDPNLFSEKTVSISQKDRPTGFIYILGTESTSPALASLKAAGKLVKIGYSTQEVRERIKNAENERTYLEAPVQLLAKIDCYNLNPQKFENLVHAFLYQQRINITLTSRDGTQYHPEEWFAIEMETAVSVCEKIIEGTITQYRMDNTMGKMVKK